VISGSPKSNVQNGVDGVQKKRGKKHRMKKGVRTLQKGRELSKKSTGWEKNLIMKAALQMPPHGKELGEPSLGHRGKKKASTTQ